MNRWLNFLSFALVAVSQAPAQLPETDIWVFEIKKDKSGNLSAVAPENITGRKGYDNQPAFSEDGRKIYYAAAHETQTDIYVYDVKKKRSARLTSTPESEYSPRPYGGSRLSAVVVEKDSAQRIHVVDAETGVFLNKMDSDSIGYYSFLNKDTVVIYKLSSPHTLRWRTVAGRREHHIADNPVRTFFPVSRHAVLFGVADSGRTHYYHYDFMLRRISPFASHAPGSPDIWWHHELGLLIAVEKKILRYDSQKRAWHTLFDLGSHPITKITRFVFSADGKRMALVDNPVKN